jgi:all-trans-retinol dehydrogenase (NAD+)
MGYYQKKRIVITGAAGGIGRLFSLQLRDVDCSLFLIDRDLDGLRQLLHELEDGRCWAEIIECDLTDLQAVQKLSARLQDEQIDLLINNAGIVKGKAVTELSDDDVMDTFMVNTIAPVILTKDLLRGMVQSDSGHVVQISSAGGLVGVPKLSDYAASKAAILSFDESIRLELHKSGSKVTTTVFCPYYIDTGMFAGVKTRFPLLLPILKPEYVVRRLYRAIERREHRVILPWFAYTTFLIKIWPPAVFDRVLSFFGINSSMDEFTGRGSR